MIVVCEPTCRRVDHERVNSGFIAALREAYPDEAMRLYADKTHFRALLQNFARDRLNIARLEHRPISLPRFTGPSALVAYRGIFGRMFDELRQVGVGKIFFLSFNLECMAAIKELKKQANFKNLKFIFVLHGLFEEIAVDRPAGLSITLPITELPHRDFLTKLRRAGVSELPGMITRGLKALAMKLPAMKHVLGPGSLRLRDVIEFDHSKDYRYVLLAPHATRNAASYLDSARFDFFTVTMPVFLSPPLPLAQNRQVKFGVYGNADSLILHNVARALADRHPSGGYEIRVIGGNHFGVEGIPYVTCAGAWGEKLGRADMEAQAAEVDLLLLLNDPGRYHVTCSGVLFEALSLAKPIVWFDNECIRQFSTEETPLGISCRSFDEYVARLSALIGDFDSHRASLSRYRDGILRRREILKGESAAAAVKRSFEW